MTNKMCSESLPYFQVLVKSEKYKKEKYYRPS